MPARPVKIRSSALAGLLALLVLHGGPAAVSGSPTFAEVAPPRAPSVVDGGGTAAAEPAYAGIVTDAARYLDLDPALIHAVITAESAYRPDAVSDRGAVGLMQLIPESGARDAYRYLYGADGIPVAEGLHRPDVNIWLGSAYLRMLMDQHLAAIPEPARTPLALAAYNWGIGNLQVALGARIPQSLGEAMAVIERRCPEDTARYVALVLSERARLSAFRSRG